MSETTSDERLALVRRYVSGNLEAWSTNTNPDPRSMADMLEVAYADIYRKVLNVIDTGYPMRSISVPDEPIVAS